MKKILFTITLMICGIVVSDAQQVGLSFSYFVPRNGYFSTPISPFSLRGVGFNLGRYFAVQTGASLYRMAGLNIIGLPYQTKDPLLGPNFTLLVPAELVFQLKGRTVHFDIKGGGFFFYGFDQKLDYGNFDRAIRQYQKWDVANSNFSFQNSPGFGTHFGAEFTVYVSSQFGISLEANYLMGSSKLPLTGSYIGGNMTGPLQTINANYNGAKVDFTGFEFSIGLIFSGNNGGGKKPPTRRRR
jgi:hypothetical protein